MVYGNVCAVLDGVISHVNSWELITVMVLYDIKLCVSKRLGRNSLLVGK